MTAIQRFCEECQNPLTPGEKFCEECGYPIAVKGTASGDSPAPSVPLATEHVPLAVIPFAYRQTGGISGPAGPLTLYSGL